MDDLDQALARARAGDVGAFSELYRTFSGPLYSYLLTQVRRREDAEDLLGEVFLGAMRDIASFSGDASGFRAWLYRIATNRAIDLARRSVRRQEGSLDDIVEWPSEADTAEDAIATAERARLRRAVEELPDLQRRAVTLRLAGGLTTTEIARVLGRRPGAVKALQHRALQNLSKALGAPYPLGAPARLGDEER